MINLPYDTALADLYKTKKAGCGIPVLVLSIRLMAGKRWGEGERKQEALRADLRCGGEEGSLSCFRCRYDEWKDESLESIVRVSALIFPG